LGGASATFAVAQDSDDPAEADAGQPPSEIIKVLRSAPASKLDVGLNALTTREWIFFAINKPDVLRKERHRFLVVEYIEFKDEIHVELSHRSLRNTADELAAECKEDIGLEVAALVPASVSMAISESGDPEEADRDCRTITSTCAGACSSMPESTRWKVVLPFTAPKISVHQRSM
jgi:hypothetical protein